MTTPFDEVINEIKKRGFHNHRLEGHSDNVSLGIFNDLTRSCESLKADLVSCLSNMLSMRASLTANLSQRFIAPLGHTRTPAAIDMFETRH